MIQFAITNFFLETLSSAIVVCADFGSVHRGDRVENQIVVKSHTI